MELPDLIGPYKLLDRIGSGAMGEVFLARAEDGTMLAVKKLRQDLVADDALRARLRREVETLAGVRSPHVAELVTADIEAGEPYIAVRYIQGRPLSDQSTPAAAHDLWHIARGLAQAVHDIATAGYIHRDLKPANVMITPGPPPSPVVIDFGISHALDATRFSRHGRTSGTPGYMAPELAYGVTPGTPTDIYAWGATVAFAATARRAHWSQLGPTEIARILYEITTLQPAFRELIEDTLNRDPTLRPTPAALLARITALEPQRGKDIFRRVELDAPTAATGTTTEVVLPGGRFVPVHVPAGSTQGTRLHLPFQGHPGKNAGPPGDLHIELDVHPTSDHKRSTSPAHRPHEHGGYAPAEHPVEAAESLDSVRLERPPHTAASPTGLQPGKVGHVEENLRRDRSSPWAGSGRKSLALLGGTMIAASAVSYVLWPHPHAREKPEKAVVQTSGAVSSPSRGPNSSVQVVEKLPDSCDLLSATTIKRFIPVVAPDDSAAPVTPGVCTRSSSDGSPYRSLTISLEDHRGDGDPIAGGKAAYQALYESSLKSLPGITVIGSMPGLGDEAFSGVQGPSQKTKEIWVTVRVANVLLTVSFRVDADKVDSGEWLRKVRAAAEEAVASLRRAT